MNEVEKRIRRLERKSRILEITLTLIAFVAITGFTMTHNSPNVVTANKFVLVDEEGRVAGLLKIQSWPRGFVCTDCGWGNPAPMLAMYDQGGAAQVVIGVVAADYPSQKQDPISQGDSYGMIVLSHREGLFRESYWTGINLNP